MKIAWIQYDIAWENQEKNLLFLEDLLVQSSEDFDLLVLPEMFDTGFSMNPSAIPNRDQHRSIQWLQKIAKQYDTAVIASMAFQENNAYYNRLVFTEGEEIAEYNKNHLFKLSGEHEKYQEGDFILDLHWKDFKIRPLICYDLRFPEISRNTEAYDLLIYVASWPEKRVDHWSSLLKARAIENQCYTLGVNRIGVDGNRLAYNGMSCLYAYDGQEIKSAESQSGIFFAEINKEDLMHYREKLPFLQDCKLDGEI